MGSDTAWSPAQNRFWRSPLECAGLVFHPGVPEVIQPYLPIAVVAGAQRGVRWLARLSRADLDPKVFVSFGSVLVAVQVSVTNWASATQPSTAIIVVLPSASFGNTALRMLDATGDEITVKVRIACKPVAAETSAATTARHSQADAGAHAVRRGHEPPCRPSAQCRTAAADKIDRNIAGWSLASGAFGTSCCANCGLY